MLGSDAGITTTSTEKQEEKVQLYLLHFLFENIFSGGTPGLKDSLQVLDVHQAQSQSYRSRRKMGLEGKTKEGVSPSTDDSYWKIMLIKEKLA